MAYDWRNITLPDQREEKTWFSPSLQREMSVGRWGRAGKPVLVFPTAGGDFLECERYMLIKTIAPMVEAGRIQVFSCGSVSGDTWLNADSHPRMRTLLQARFDDYISRELLPYLDAAAGGQKVIAAGASLGAYNALNAATKHPDRFGTAICMSGTYDFKRWTDGHFDDDYYFNMPLHWLPNLGESKQLDLLRQSRFVLASGQGRAEAPWESTWIANIMKGKGIPHHLEIWGQDVHHDWPTWRTMLPMFLDRLV